jgi:phosphatidylethanolamine-binding protein (PEBP) family uncharacterized protein
MNSFHFFFLSQYFTELKLNTESRMVYNRNARIQRIQRRINKTRKPYSRRTIKNIRKLSIGGASLQKPSFTVSYNTGHITINKSNSGIDLTTASKNNELKEQPLITLTYPFLDMQTTQYLIVMFDSDAPYGKEHILTNQHQNQNHIWTHWVAVMTQSTENSQSYQINNIISYRQPSPPMGTHRYYIRVYTSNSNIKPPEINNTSTNEKQRGNYFETKLKSFLDSNINNRKLTFLDEIMFEVKHN